MYHLFLQHVRLDAEAFRKMRVVGAESFLCDVDSPQDQRLRLLNLSL